MLKGGESMELLIELTGDPWYDRGAINLYSKLRGRPVFDSSRSYILDNEVYIAFNGTKEEIADTIYGILKQSINDMALLPPELKMIEHTVKYDDDGFVAFKTEVDMEPHMEKLKERLSNVPKKSQYSLLRNYVGIRQDILRLQNNHVKDVDKFVACISEDFTSNKLCPVCNRQYNTKTKDSMTQNKNPFYNQHHNVPIRGALGSLATGEMCAVCNLVNIFAALDPNTPYFIDNRYTNIFLPILPSFNLIEKTRQNLNTGNNLEDMRALPKLSYGTNVVSLKHRDVYNTLIALYYSMLYKYSPEKEEYIYFPVINELEQREISDWVVCRYRKGRNVIFGPFSHINVHSNIFKLVEELPLDDNSIDTGNIFIDFLNQIYSDDSNIVEGLAKGVVYSDIYIIARNIFMLYKEGCSRDNITYRALRFFSVFMEKFMEVNDLLDATLSEDLKVFGRMVGQYFPTDIATMTEISNVTNTMQFKKAISNILFKMFKLSASEGNVLDEQWIIGENRVTNILNQVNSQNLSEAKDVLLIYACLSAMRESKVKRSATKKEEVSVK